MFCVFFIVPRLGIAKVWETRVGLQESQAQELESCGISVFLSFTSEKEYVGNLSWCEL